MCGIAGCLDPDTPLEEREGWVEAMCRSMVHRGPDDGGIETRGTLTLGMRRLAIFDPTHGHQPMSTPDGRFVVVFNGALYNYKELQQELESYAWRFATHCDTEVLLAALVQWGEAALGRLRGMYAFAFWDEQERTLLLARDPFGIKPLYVARSGRRITFCSEASALVSSGAHPAQVDPASVADYLAWLAVPAPRTLFRGVDSLEPGESLKVAADGSVTSRRWSLRQLGAGVRRETSREAFTAALRERLDDSIRHHLLADVPVGAFLSGGLDSAVVVGLMSRLSNRALQTFSIGFEEDGYSEADLAESTAKHFGAVHHTRILTGDEVARDIEKVLRACDQPTGDGVNTYYASETAHEGNVKVALSGLGGDELFGGYASFRRLPSLAAQAAAFARAPEAVRKAAGRILSLGGARGRKYADILANARDAHEVAALQRRVFSHERLSSLLNPDAARQARDAGPFHPKLAHLRAELDASDLFSVASGWELRTYMADVLLRDSDVMSMRHSLELRVPFVDLPLASWLWAQDPRFKNAGGRPKGALLDATADILPAGLLGRRKRGFTLPFPLWMRGALRPFLEETFSAESVSKSGLFAPQTVRAQWAAFLASRDDRDWSRLWSLAVLVAFVNRAGAPARRP